MAEQVIFPDCCGFIIINKFKGGHPGADEDSCISTKDLDKYLSGVEKKYFKERAGLLAVLSDPQNERIGSVFRDRKWVLLLKKDNPRTGGKLYMYFRDLNYTEAREKRIFGDKKG